MTVNITINELANLLIENDIEFEHKRVTNTYDRMEPERSYLIVGDYWVKFSANRTGKQLRKITKKDTAPNYLPDGRIGFSAADNIKEVSLNDLFDAHHLWIDSHQNVRVTNNGTFLVTEEGTVADITNPEHADGTYMFSEVRFFEGENGIPMVLVGELKSL